MFFKVVDQPDNRYAMNPHAYFGWIVINQADGNIGQRFIIMQFPDNSFCCITCTDK